uniref:Uncharacterized protein n=1 Tax=Setaria viridis TaxID=4556 RepID=A0A4U6VHT7_SETVI|nr:hypothetical protein SEVIR_3G378850v2 [Setaria viridis]
MIHSSGPPRARWRQDFQCAGARGHVEEVDEPHSRGAATQPRPSSRMSAAPARSSLSARRGPPLTPLLHGGPGTDEKRMRWTQRGGLGTQNMLPCHLKSRGPSCYGQHPTYRSLRNESYKRVA